MRRPRGWWLALVAAAAAAGVVAAGGDADAKGGGKRGRRAWKVRPVEVADADRQAVLDGSVAFALDLWRRLPGPDEGDQVCSPASATVALGMLLEAARGTTREELASVLRVPLPEERAAPAFQSVLADLAPGPGSRHRLALANALWTARQLSFRPGFAESLGLHFGARAAEADFASDPERARRRVNAWGRRHTWGVVEEVLPAGSVHELTAFVLANAVYFKGRWARPFPREATAERPFRLADGTVVDTPTMAVEGTFRVASRPGLTLVELPYEGDETALLVAVPDDPAGLASLEAALTPELLVDWVDALGPEHVALAFPRFRTRSRLDLEAPLAATGMPTAFVPFDADLSGAVGLPGETFVEQVLQAAEIRVDERGTEAAAVTAVTVAITSAPPPLAVDRPFLYLLRHRETGLVLFLGRMTDPRADGP